MWTSSQVSADLLTFTKESSNEILTFLQIEIGLCHWFLIYLWTPNHQKTNQEILNNHRVDGKRGAVCLFCSKDLLKYRTICQIC